MKGLATLLAFSGWAAIATAAPPAVQINPPKPAPGQLVTLSSAEPLAWDVRGASHLPSPDGKSVALYLPATPIMVLASGTNPTSLDAVAVIALGAGSPVPPGPGPTPPPTPPPPPSDPLTRRIHETYTGDAAPVAEKREHAKKLAALYAVCVRLMSEPDLGNAGDLFDRVRNAAQVMAPDALLGVRRIVAEELSKILPTDADEPITSTHRKAGAELFGRLSVALETVPE